MKKTLPNPSTYDANACIPAEKVLDLLRSHLDELNGDNPAKFYLRQQVWSKYNAPDPDSAARRKAAAIEKWMLTEEKNAETNERLILTEDHYVLPCGLGTFGRFKRICSDIISRCIGDVPPDELNYEFSGGASTSRPRTRSFAASKYAGRVDITGPCLDWFIGDLISYKGWLRQPVDLDLNLVQGNVMFTVPKNSEIDRCACKEPDINMFVQKGIGNHFRRALRKLGIDLNDQSINRSLAQYGSKTGSLATVDLSAASDSVTTALCEALLPTLWYSLLMTTRSSHTSVYEGTWHCNEMMSSMGNGFTFELESLLFYAIARTVCIIKGVRGRISVYGDDLIVPVTAYQPLEAALTFLGFSFNQLKSYERTPFRESCGGHYYGGLDITPFYIKGPPKKIMDVIHLCNQIRKWSDRQSVGGLLDPTLEPLWQELTGFVPLKYWGGVDMDSKDALVTARVPRVSYRLVPIVEDRALRVGDYVRSLHMGPAGEKPTKATGRYRPKKATTSFTNRNLMRVYPHEMPA